MTGPPDQAPHPPDARRPVRKPPLLRLRPRAALLVLVVGVLVASVLGWAHVSGRSHADGAPARPARTAQAHPASVAPLATDSTTTTVPLATTVPPTTVPPTTAPPTTAPPTTTTTGPGSLPQSAQVPTTTTPEFQTEMAALWSGVVTGSATPAMAAFFPEAAYAQLKAIGSPQYDWSVRLVGNFVLDLAAAHGLLGADPSSAMLAGVDVPAQYEHWVPAGDCFNSVGYYEVPNARVVYTENGQTMSFGIASMISWRGEWYVVHLGAVESYTSSQGVVDDPQSGPGYPVDSGSC